MTKPVIVTSKPGTLIKEEWVSLGKTLGALIVSAVLTTVLKFALEQLSSYQASGEIELALMGSLTMIVKTILKSIETTKYVR